MDESRPNASLDYAPRRKPTTWARAFVFTLVTVFFVALLLFILAPVLNEALHDHHHDSIRTGSNVRQIGQTAMSYAVEHDRAYPDSLETLARWEGSYLPPERFASPLGPATPALDFDTLFGEPGHISYIYIGGGLTIDTAKGGTPLVYEGPVTDFSKGTHVYFADGSLRVVKGDELRKLLSEADERTGHRPLQAKRGRHDGQAEGPGGPAIDPPPHYPSNLPPP